MARRQQSEGSDGSTAAAAVDERIVDLVRRDASGAAMNELLRTTDPAVAAATIAAVLRTGGATPAQLQPALAFAVVTGNAGIAEALGPHLHTLNEPVLQRTFTRACERGAEDIAAHIATAFFPQLPAVTAPTRPDAMVRVLGMHRSGTSSYALVARRLGADVGLDRELIPPAPDNPRGFHEHRPLVLAADRLLSLLGGTWHAPPSPPGPELLQDTAMRAVVRGAAATLQRFLTTTSGVALWKDPRTSLLLPLWDLVLPDLVDDVRDIHVVRAPDAVVASLARRSDMHPEHAARLWVRYVTDTCRARPDVPLFHAEELLADPRTTAERLAAALEMPSVDGATIDHAAAAVEASLQTTPRVADDAGPWLRAARDIHALVSDGDTAAAVEAADAAIERHTPPPAAAGQPVAVLAAGLRPRDLGPAHGPASLGLARRTAEATYEATSLGWAVMEHGFSQYARQMAPRAVWFGSDADLEAGVRHLVVASPRTRVAASRPHQLADDVVSQADAAAWLVGAEQVAQEPPCIGPVPSRSRTDVTSIVIPVHGNWELTDQCLDALVADTSEPVEIIVVDDASPDETTGRLATDDRVDVLITLGDNVGFPTAVNTGLAAASGQRICILNNDTLPLPGWLSALRRVLAVDGVALVGPRTNEISGPQRIHGAPRGRDDLDQLRPWGKQYLAGTAARSWPYPRLVGFCLLADASLFETIGGLDQGVGTGNFEDDEFCARAQQEGDLRVVDDSLVLHVGSATFGTADRWVRAMLEGARHVDGRLHKRTVPLAVVVLTDGEPAATEQTVRSVAGLDAPVHVIDRSDPAQHQTWVTQVGGTLLHHGDWTAGGTLETFTGGTADAAVVLLAGETVTVHDSGAVRAAVEHAQTGTGIGGFPGVRLLQADVALDLATFSETPPAVLDGLTGR